MECIQMFAALILLLWNPSATCIQTPNHDLLRPLSHSPMFLVAQSKNVHLTGSDTKVGTPYSMCLRCQSS